ncbi:MAG: hypothetical protein ABL974_22410, partial [Prosthecobacter sp.]
NTDSEVDIAAVRSQIEAAGFNEPTVTEYERTGKGGVFAVLSAFLSWKAEAPSYEESAAKLGINEQAARVAVHRLRKRYRDLLQKNIATTVESEAEIDAELDHLMQVFTVK